MNPPGSRRFVPPKFGIPRRGGGRSRAAGGPAFAAPVTTGVPDASEPSGADGKNGGWRMTVIEVTRAA